MTVHAEDIRSVNGVSGLTEEEKMDAALILIGADIPGGGTNKMIVIRKWPATGLKD